MRAGSSNSRCKLVLNTRDFGTSIRSVGPMEKLDARAVEFASPVQDELIQSLCGVYNKVGKWNGKSYYEKAPTPDDVEGQPSFAMWFTMAPILAGEDELVAGYSWLVTPKDDIAMVWASVWQGEEDESLCPPAEGWGAAGDDSTWLASVHACVPSATGAATKTDIGEAAGVSSSKRETRSASGGGYLPASAKACAVPPPPPPPVKGKGMGKVAAPPPPVVAHGPKPPTGPPPGWAKDKGKGKTAAEKKSLHASNPVEVKKMPTQPSTPPPRKKRNVYVAEDGTKMMTVVDEAGNAMERKYVRDTDELRAAMESAIADADKDEAKKRAERDAQTASGPESPGRRRHRSCQRSGQRHGEGGTRRPVVPMLGVRQRDNKGRKRGGWYNRCQLTMEAVLSGNMDIAIQLSEKFYGGQNEF